MILPRQFVRIWLNTNRGRAFASATWLSIPAGAVKLAAEKGTEGVELTGEPLIAPSSEGIVLRCVSGFPADRNLSPSQSNVRRQNHLPETSGHAPHFRLQSGAIVDCDNFSQPVQTRIFSYRFDDALFRAPVAPVNAASGQNQQL